MRLDSFGVVVITMDKTTSHHCTCSKGSEEKRLGGSVDVVRKPPSVKVMICKHFN